MPDPKSEPGATPPVPAATQPDADAEKREIEAEEEAARLGDFA